LSGAKTDPLLAQKILDTWLTTPFAGGRHQRRLDKISRIEDELIIPGAVLDKES
jgi:ribose 5-phosphate isomerase B